MNKIQEYLKNNQNESIKRLKQFLSLPSISTDSKYKKQMLLTAQYVSKNLKDARLNVKIMATGKNEQGHPVVYAKTKDEQVENPNAPRILFYGHYDVQPPDPLEKWDSGPFAPHIKDNTIYARGASDDKGQVACFLEALLAYSKTKQKFPCHITVLIEGEEECGSENLPQFIDEHKKELQADVAIISDTTMWVNSLGKPVPAICYALRGLLYFDIKLYGPKRDLHSGVYGGTLANPAVILTKILGNIFDNNHRITIPNFYDDVIGVDKEEKENWSKLDFDKKSFFNNATENIEPFGEAGFSTLERRWARPSCDINGLYGGYQGEGAKTVIPTFAGAKLSFRLAANQNPDNIASAFHSWINNQNLHGLRLEITEHGRAHPVKVNTNSPWIDAASKAIKQTSGQMPALVREGATIPVVSDFKQKLAIDSLLIGFGLDSDAIHSPNEHISLDRFALGCQTHAALLEQIGNLKKQ